MRCDVCLFLIKNICSLTILQAGRLGGRLVGEILAEHLERMVQKAEDLVLLEAAEGAAEVKKQKKVPQAKGKENNTANKKKTNIVNILNENTKTVNKTEQQTNTPGLKIPECPVCLTEMGTEVLQDTRLSPSLLSCVVP